MLRTALYIALALVSTAVAEDELDPRARIADAYGYPGWSEVDELRYTFHARLGDKTMERSWRWQPKTMRITYTGPGEDGRPETVTYHRNTPREQWSDAAKRIDRAYINDRYWLLFPFHVLWDTSAEVEDTGMHQRPLGDGEARRITVRYPAEGGYTPGDVYELFVDNGYRILEWVYRHGGAEKPTRMSTWENHAQLGPIIVSLDHRGADDFRVWFTDVGLRAGGSDQWRKARVIE